MTRAAIWSHCSLQSLSFGRSHEYRQDNHYRRAFPFRTLNGQLAIHTLGAFFDSRQTKSMVFIFDCKSGSVIAKNETHFRWAKGNLRMEKVGLSVPENIR